jgi:hypothetical protein
MDLVPRLGAFRQPFAWAIVPLFNEPEPLPASSSSSSTQPNGSKRSSLSDSYNFTLALGPGTEFKQIYRYKGNDFDDQHFMDTVSEYSKVLFSNCKFSTSLVKQLQTQQINPWSCSR